MKKIIQAIKAFFSIKKLLKKGEMSLEQIRNMWVLLGGIVLGFNFTWIPEWIQGLFQPDGTQAVFAVISAVIALLQFTPFRKGKTTPGPEQLKAEKDTNKLLYLIPIWPAKAA